MRHEITLMDVGPPVRKGKMVYRWTKCPVCGLSGGEMKSGYFLGQTKMCCGFDDDTGRPCRLLPPEPPEADTPVIVEAK